MADYFTQFSAMLTTESHEKALQVHALFNQFVEERLNEDESVGFTVEVQNNDLYISDTDANGSPDDVISFFENFAPKLALTGYFGFEWANTCSKPRLDAFGGGACVINLATGECVEVVSTNNWLATKMNLWSIGVGS